MNTVLVIIISLLVLIVWFVVYRLISVRKAADRAAQRKLELIKVLHEKLENKIEITREEVYPFVSNVLTRKATFLLLREHNRLKYFPSEFYSIEKGAESDLANWLEFPTELAAVPDEMEYVKKVVIDFDGKGNNVIYHVFRFRVNKPHWAAAKGWMLGVTGPFFDDSNPFDRSTATFSRLTPVDSIAPEAEAEWVHKNISMRKLS